MDNKTIKITKKGDDGHTNISLRLRNNILGELDNIVAKTNRSRNELINMLLEFAVKNCELDEG